MPRRTMSDKTRWARPSAILFFLLVVSLCLPLQTFSATEPIPFEKDEKMVYRIRWSFIPAGEAVLEATRESGTLPNQDAPVLHFSLIAKTYPALDLIYKYWERIDSYTTSSLGHSLLYKKRQTGKTERDIVVEFNWESQQAQYTNFGSSLPPIDLVPGTLDPLSALYFIRRQQLTEGLLIERPVTDGKKTVNGSAKVLKRETLTIHGTTYNTFKLEPELKEVKGVFEKSQNAKMHIWITDDSRKLVVKLKSKVVVGSFIAELIDTPQAVSEYGEQVLETEPPSEH